MESKKIKEILHNMKEDVIYHFDRFTIEKHHNKFIFRNFLDNKHDFNDYVTRKSVPALFILSFFSFPKSFLTNLSLVSYLELSK